MQDDLDESSFWETLMRRLTLLIVIGIPLAFALWSFGSLKFVYSRGERAGYIQKISKRGWIFKTWEGELAMANLPGTLPQIFDFTVRDENVAHQMEKIIGQRASVTYEQHKGLPGTIFGETEYFVVRVSAVADPYQPQPAAK